jgi:NAD(P)-dependent dehydrogenase (short-subunit alcohol dehydrogenase family)
MLSYTSIQAFAARCNSLDRLDIAILNIGIGFATTCKLAPTGHEETIQVNYLSTALLSILLLPVLGRCEKPGRLSIVGSGTALFTPFANITANPLLPSFDLPYSGTSAGAERYGVSKLLVLMLVHTLSQHVSPNRVIINSPEPGLTADTSLHRDFSRSGKILMGLGKKMMGRTTEQAAYTYVDAVGSHGKESHGGFIVLWEICGMPAIMHTGEGKSAMERLWEETMVELDFADVKGILASIK